MNKIVAIVIKKKKEVQYRKVYIQIIVVPDAFLFFTIHNSCAQTQSQWVLQVQDTYQA